ncbi:MAG: T9SS type A sorting domain-containing protein [Candidatus Latescibacteria bacterium]|nr:T9SS type A sorting domain-containing protein [Candidatus Latescibacterota bacterium]
MSAEIALRRSRLFASLLTVLLLATCLLAAEGQLIKEKIHSAALEGNLLGDSPENSVWVYLPPSYDSLPEKYYPVVYLLHGYLMESVWWLGGGLSGGLFNISSVLNRFMTEHPDRELILVMPDGHNRYLGSWYVNSPVTGNWEDFLTQELVRYVDSTYRTLPQTAHRGIAGYSMGGSGAWILATRYPEVYGAVYSLSGGIAPHGPVDATMWRRILGLETMEQFGGLPNYFYQAQVSLAAAFSPNPDKPPFFVDFPFELVGEELRVVEPVWQKWLASLDLPVMMHTYQEQLRQLRGIRFGCGDQETDILPEHLATAQALTNLGTPYAYETYKGTHTSGIPSRVETYVLPFFAQALYGYFPRVRQSTADLGSALAGQPLTPNLQIEFVGPLEATGAFPQVSLDLSPLGLEEVPLHHDGQGRYTLDATIVPPHNGRYRLPVRLHTDSGEPYLFYNAALDVWPVEEQALFTDSLDPEWQTTTIGSTTLDPQATTPVFQGTFSLAVKVNSSTLRLLSAESLEVFGYTLHFAFHPGDATGGTRPVFNLVLKGSDSGKSYTHMLIDSELEGAGIELARKEWQTVELPLDSLKIGDPIISLSFQGNLKGTFYLDDIRLVPQAAPQPTAVEEERTDALPQSFSLAQNYPNPFNSGTVVQFSLPQSAEIELAVYNLAGQKVATMVKGRREAGAYTVRWDGRDERGEELASGIYFYRLEAGPQVETRKLLLLR